jgi:predicted Zn-dependent protease
MSASPSPVEAAAVLLGAGEPAEAAALLRPYAEDLPGYAGALVVYARALELSGDAQAALRAWHRAHFFAPDSPLVRRERQRLLRTALPSEVPSEGPADWVRDEHPPVPEAEVPEAEAHETAAAGGPVAPDLDALIERLENAPRIRPDSPFEDVDAPEAQDAQVVSETMASILAAQGQHAEAARLYDTLAEQRPADAERFRETARALRSQASA